MKRVELHLLRCSASFASRLIAAACAFSEPHYYFHRRVNWSYRFGGAFYDREAAHFQAAPDAYLRNRLIPPPQLEDVYPQKLGWKQSFIVVMKVLAHWLFHMAGRVANNRSRTPDISIYRKGYVDDIDLVFDPLEPGVLLAVYPFPISVLRQIRYLSFLRGQGRRFKLAGLPYLPRDMWRFLLRRDVRSVMRLESRAQIRHARQLVAWGFRTVQLSDEFEIGSLDFARYLARCPIRVVNSAHGVGTYLPVHAYPEFHVLTQRQQQYYKAVRHCTYRLRILNDRWPLADRGQVPLANNSGRIDVVFLSQLQDRPDNLISDNEASLLKRLRNELPTGAQMRLHYKPHPNRNHPVAPEGFRLLSRIQEVNGLPGTVFLSFFSTCQIDPGFKGRKILVRGKLIYPDILFDESEEIMNPDELIESLRCLAIDSVEAPIDA